MKNEILPENKKEKRMLSIFYIFFIIVIGIFIYYNYINKKTYNKQNAIESTIELKYGEPYKIDLNSKYDDIVWTSSDPELVTVDENGNLSIINNRDGSVIITATTKNNQIIANVTVEITKIDEVIHVTGIEIDKNEIKLNYDETAKINTVITPDNATNKEVIWTSSDTSLVSIDNKGNIKATENKDGTAIVTGKTADGGLTKSATVEVKSIKVNGVKLNKSEVTLKYSETYKLTATVSPSNAGNKKVTWTSSNPELVSVDSLGTISVNNNKNGTATITAITADGNFTDSVKVTVKAVTNIKKVTGVKLNKSEVTLKYGETSKLAVTISPSNATNKTITWTNSDSSLVSLDANGNIKAIGNKDGTATITVKTKDGGYTASVKVIVKSIKVTGIKLDKSTLTLNYGKTAKLTATVSPANAANKAITWTSSNPSIATVSTDGTVTAVDKGKATITATTKDGSYKASSTIKVIATSTAVKVTGIKLSKENVSLKYGESTKLEAIVEPSNATNKTVSWKSSNTELVTVDSDGNVTAKSGKIGVAIITATTKDGNFSQKVQIKIFPLGNHISFKGGSNYTKYKTNMLLQREGAVMQSFAINDNYVYITQQQATVGAYFSKIKLDSVTNSTGTGQVFKNNVAIIRDTGHAGNIDIEVAKDGTYLWTGCSVDGAETAYHCRIPLNSIQFGNKIVQDQQYDIKVSGGTLISVDEDNRIFVVLTGFRRYHKYSVYNLDNYITAARNGIKPTVISSFTIDRKNKKYHRQGFSVYGNYIYEYEGNYTNEKDNDGNPVPYDIFLSIYTLDGKEIVGRTKINYPDNDYYWEPEGIQIYNNKIYIGIGRIEKKSNPKKTANIYVLK